MTHRTTRPAITRRSRALAAGLAGCLLAGSPTVVQSITAPSIAAAAATPSTSAALAPITLFPVADTFVTADDPTGNFGSKTFMDVYGGTDKGCNAVGAPTYGLLKFDLSSIPAGAVVTGATLKVTTRAGYSQVGAADQNHHLIRLANTTWNENTLTWNSFRSFDPLPTPGSELLAGGADVRTSASAVGSIAVARSCETTPTDQAKQFPTNGLGGSTGELMTYPQAASNFVTAIADARSTANGLVSFEIMTPGTNGKSTWARYYTKETGDPAVRPKLVLTFGGASVIQAVPVVSTAGTSGTAVTVKLSSAPNTTYTVNVLSGTTCLNGQLQNPTLIGTFTAPTDASGSVYAAGTVAPSSGFVAAYITSPSGEISAPSNCVRVGPDNDAWTRAAPIVPGTARSFGYIDTRGGSRWFRFPVQPGGTVKVDLRDLPADYDLAVFTDIAKAYSTLTSNTDLTRLSAEFAPSVFSPSVFSPDAYSPSVFSPTDYAPSVFSPSVFSPSVFSPSVFSPDAYSPSVFSPSVFSPSVFSPSVFSPSVFSPSVFSPSVFSSDGTAPSVFSPEAFASAQTRSLVGVSYTTGTGDEAVVANVWNNTGNFYIRVSGRNGVTSTDAPFALDVSRDDLPACSGVAEIGTAPAAVAGSAQSLIFVDSARMLQQPGNTDGAGGTVPAMLSKLTSFAARTEVGGVVVDLSADSRVSQLNAQADRKAACPYAKNLVAGAIKDIVNGYRAGGNPLRYIVLVGPDGAIPFFRYPDETLLGPESDYVPPVSSSSASEATLRLNYVLGQDEYGSTTTLNLGNAEFPVPDLAVGRLVETAAEASGMLDAYGELAAGVKTPSSSLVTGYDFLTDAARAVQAELVAGIGSGPGKVNDDLLAENNISPEDSQAWTATQLRAKLFDSRHDITFLAGHFSANSALAADFKTSVLSSELLAPSTADFKNAVVFSAGCHSGYNIVDGDAIPGVTVPLDWVQAFARKKATLIAGTGYQYGDTDFLEYSERIYSGFAKQLRYGSGPVSVGEALARAKQTYLEETPDIRGLHRKALLQSALFGLPMLRIDMPAGRIAAPARASIIGGTVGYTTNPGLTLGLSSADTTVLSAPLTAKTVVLKTAGGAPDVTATYYTGPDGVASNPVEPALPLVVKNVTVQGKVLRGVGFRGGSYTDTPGIVPLTGAATTELRNAHVSFESPVFFPMRIATPNYYDALSGPTGGGTTTLQVTPVQHKAIPDTDTAVLRKYDSVNLRLFYSSFDAGLTQAAPLPALSAAPSISGITAAVQGTDVVFRANVTGNPAAGVQQVWITYTGNSPAWTSLDLQQCVVTAAQPTLPGGCVGEDSTLWVGRLVGGATGSGNLQFMVQAVNGVGLVTLDDALGDYYKVPTGGFGPLTPSRLAITAPSSAAYGGTPITASATLTSGGNAVPGKSVFFTVGTTRTVATTGPDGVASSVIPVKVVPGQSSVRASFAGDAGLRASAATAPLTVSKSATSLTLNAVPPPTPANPATPPTPPGLLATLVANGKPLPARTVYLVFKGVGPDRIVPVITDYVGRARLGAVTFGAGTYTVTARFLGQIESPVNALLTDLTYEQSQATAEVNVVAVNDVEVKGSVVSSVAPISGMVNAPQTYSYTITNNGPDMAKNVTFTSVLPDTVINASAKVINPSAPEEVCTVTPPATRTVTCSLPSVDTGATKAKIVSITVTPTVVGTLTNTASVIADGFDSPTSNNSASVTNDVKPEVVAPGTVTVFSSPTVLAGSVYTATVSLSNVGTVKPAPTYSLVGAPSNPALSISTDPLTGVVSVSGTVPVSGITSFTYKVAATNAGGTSTSDPVNVTVTPVADLSVAGKAPGQFIGTPTTFQLLVTNNSAFASNGPVTVDVTLSIGLKFSTVEGTAWDCGSPGSVTFTCKLKSPTIAARSTVPLYLNVAVEAAVGTPTRLTAVVSPNDPVPANNTLILVSSVKRKP